MVNTLIYVARKGTAAAILALATGLGVAMNDGNLTTTEIITSLGAALIAFAGVYATPANNPVMDNNTPDSNNEADEMGDE